MSNSSRKILVYDHFSNPEPILLGYLYVDNIRGGESYSFEYDDCWLAQVSASRFLDPDLMPYGGRQFPSNRSIFGLFADASPDRWGRVLMMKKERILAEKEKRKQRKN